MKSKRIRAVNFDNRQRVLDVEYASGQHVRVHYGHLGTTGKLDSAWVDRETRGLAVGMRLENGTEEFMPYDQPLALVRDPEHVLRTQLERVLDQKHISKRYLAKQLQTSDNQIQRLLDPAIVNKNLEQLYRIALLLGIELQWRISDAA